MTVLVGTSGWQYRDWKGSFYPERLSQRDWLSHYTSQFATVENDGVFYRLPEQAIFEAWRAHLPEGFVMSVKASRFLTHMKRLREPTEPVGRLMKATAGLGDRLGPVLLQLPPNLQSVPERLAECLDRFPADVRVAVEPRHKSWWNDEVRAVLEEHDAALCWADRKGRPVTPLWRTASWGYLRMHQGVASPPPSYGDAALRAWCRRLAETWPAAADRYVYFNNDQGGAAPRDALRFAALAREKGMKVADPYR